MIPTTKSTQIDDMIRLLCGADRILAIELNECIFEPIGCGQAVTTFRDKQSEREYRISGLCQACQDRIFVDPSFN